MVFNQYNIEDWPPARETGYDCRAEITQLQSADYNCRMYRFSNFLAATMAAPLLLLAVGWCDAAGPPAGADTHSTEPAPGMFLVSARQLRDRHFKKTVVYILRHNRHGTLGLIINRPGALPLSRALDNIDSEHGRHHRLFFGGPVETSVITMLMDNIMDSPLVEHIAGDIYFSDKRIVMETLLKEKQPTRKLHFFHGHAGWGAGQLDQELDRGDWHLIEGNARSIFSSEIKSLWHRLIRKLEPLGIIVLATELQTTRSN